MEDTARFKGPVERIRDEKGMSVVAAWRTDPGDHRPLALVRAVGCGFGIAC